MQGGGSPQPYEFTGREADETGLMYYRARYYHPSWGRFVSEDPTGFAQVFAVADQLGQEGSLTADNPLISEGVFNGATVKGLAGFEMGANPFLYGKDNPINNTDPSGLQDSPGDMSFVGVILPPQWFMEDVGYAGAYYGLKFLNWLSGGLLMAVDPLDPRTAREIIAAERKGSINREFPGEYYGDTPAEIIEAKNAGISRARRAWKLLNDNRFRK